MTLQEYIASVQDYEYIGIDDEQIAICQELLQYKDKTLFPGKAAFCEIKSATDMVKEIVEHVDNCSVKDLNLLYNSMFHRTFIHFEDDCSQDTMFKEVT